MNLEMDYGRHGLNLTLPDSVDVFLARDTASLADETAAIRDALRNPIGSAPLRERLRPGMTVVIVHTDITRATPNDRLLPVILSELEAGGIRREDITLLNGLGTHRAQTEAELRRMLGSEIVDRYRCLQHDAYDEAGLVSLGTTRRGHPLKVNKQLLEADLKILTGFIEPHFFAGYSGGPKAVLPGVAGAETVLANHGPEMIAHPQATFDRTTGNPIWEEMLEAALQMENTFLVNVTLNRENAITGVFAGEVAAAHAQGCDHVRAASLFTVAEPYDLVVTTNSGYPLDQNLYQCVKGLAAAARAVRPGGTILLLAGCEEGLPDQSEYARILHEAGSPQAVLDRVTQPGFTGQDGWQVQIQAQVQLKADVYIYSEGLSDEQIAASLLRPCRDLVRGVPELMARYGSRVCALPQGPLTVLEVGK
jgi:nickel-dependent lactate racemase